MRSEILSSTGRPRVTASKPEKDTVVVPLRSPLLPSPGSGRPSPMPGARFYPASVGNTTLSSDCKVQWYPVNREEMTTHTQKKGRPLLNDSHRTPFPKPSAKPPRDPGARPLPAPKTSSLEPRGDRATGRAGRALPAATTQSRDASVLLFLFHQNGCGRARPRPPQPRSQGPSLLARTRSRASGLGGLEDCC